MTQRKKVDLVFDMSELTYDMKNYAYIEGEKLGDENPKMKNLVQGICDDGNVDRVKRTIDMAFNRCVETLFPYTKAELTGNMLSSNFIDAKDKYLIGMYVRPAMSKTSFNVMKGGIHEYVVCSAVGDWLSTLGIETAAMWLEKAAVAMESVVECINMRVRPVTRKLSVMG